MKKMDKLLKWVLVLEVILICFSAFFIKQDRKKEEDKIANYWFNKYSIVAHGMGAIDGLTYTNSLEAFNYNYDNGTRVFEIDVALTSDQRIVLTHGWQEHKMERLSIANSDKESMTYNEFLSQPIYGKYTPLALEDVIRLMKQYPDIYIVLDWGKDLDYNAEEDKDYIFEIDDLIKRNQLLIEQFKENDESLLDRVIPQIYYEEHFNKLNKLHSFDNYIYTLYKNYQNTNPREIMNFIKSSGIKVVVTNFYGTQEIITKEINRQINYDRIMSKEYAVFIHTINENKDLVNLLNQGYKGIFTDLITENQAKEAIKIEENKK